MSDKAKGPLRRACGFIWRSVTALRRGLANLIFIAILAVVVIALVMERELKIEPGSTLLLAPTGGWSTTTPCWSSGRKRVAA